MEKLILATNTILALYAFFLLFLIMILLRKKKFKKVQIKENISIIVPFRNESKNLGDLLLSLGTQNYKGKFELILVNDGSTDNFSSVIDHLTETLQYSIKVINSHYDKSIKLTGKQQALDTGVEAASYEWLAFTDADVTLDKTWLSSLMSQAENKRTIVFGHTSIGGSRLSFIERYSAFQLEYLFSAAYTFNLAGIHGSCMGNNLLISKSLYSEIGGQENIGYTITEDMQLVNRAISIGAVVESVKPFYPTVFTSAPSTLNGLLHQAIRWAKGGIKSSFAILLITMVSSFQSILVLILPFLIFHKMCYNTVNLSLINVLLLTLYLSIFIRRTNSPAKLSFFPFFYIMYAFQSLLLAIPLFFLKPKWKDREI